MKNSKFYALLLATAMTASTQAQVTPASQMEKLDRGLVAVPESANKNFVSWRLFGTDDKNGTTFDLLRDGKVIASDLKETNYMDTQGTATSAYQVVTKVNGETVDASKEVMAWAKKFLSLKLDQPAKGDKGGTYTPNDISVGDVDGDGQYELIVKWDPSTSQDNGSNGTTDKVYLDAYRMDGTKLWRIDMGENIRAGAHYTQFMVYDFDGDGKAEVMCKTATRTKDGKGNYVNQAATDATIKGHGNSTVYRNSNGHIISGPEYLTVFKGETGEAIHTTWYLPGRAGTGDKLPSGTSTTEGGSELGKVSDYPGSSFWGDGNGNRSERYLAAVAYINGADKNACGIFCRGYYTKAYVWAVSFDGTRLHTEWLHASPEHTRSLVFDQTPDQYASWEVDGETLYRHPFKTAPANTGGIPWNGSSQGSNTLFANGNHNLSIADVDGDGCDEIIWGAGALNNDGSLLYATGYGHGDAMHVAKMIADSTDLYVFDVHEEKLATQYGSWDMHNARTGRIIHHGGNADSDNGRGMAAALVSGIRAYQFWSNDERNPRSATTGNVLISKNCTVNFRIYWDGSNVDQLFDGAYSSSDPQPKPYIQKWNGSSFTNVLSFNSAEYNYAQTCNTTKSTPCLQADILGDWREELIMWSKDDPSEINIYTTWTPTEYAVPTLMHDHVYRMGVAWQNTAYNQPPHLGYFLPDYTDGKLTNTGIESVEGKENIETVYDLQGCQHNGLKLGLNIVRTRKADGTIVTKKIIIK